MAPRIIAHFPPHRVYVEPYGGAASVLLRKPRAYAEYYCDLDDEVVTFFDVLRDPASAARLEAELRLTPYARAEFERSYEPAQDPVERARRLLVRSFMGHGSDGATSAYKTSFRATSDRSYTTPAHDWRNYPASLPAIAARLQGVIIENKPAMEVMAERDREDALHYLDPPYLPETRSRLRQSGPVNAAGVNTYRRGAYRFEMTPDEHTELLAFVKTLRGAVVLSGYPSALYDDALGGWHRVEIDALADGAKKRIEVLWINPSAAAALDQMQTPLLAWRP